jgi:hypothetical protein
VEQELLTIPEHLSSHRVLVGVRFTRSLVLRVWFVDRCLSYWRFCFDHCVVCPLINGFWLPLWYLQTLLTLYFPSKCNMLVLCHIKHPLAHVIVHVVLVLFWITQTYKNLNCVDEVCVYIRTILTITSKVTVFTCTIIVIYKISTCSIVEARIRFTFVSF